MGIGRRTDVVSVNMQWVDIKKIGYKFLLITDFLRRFITDLLGSTCTEWRLSPFPGFPPLVSRIHFPRCVLCGRSPPRLPWWRLRQLHWVLSQSSMCTLNQRGKSPNPPYHLPFVGLRVASTKNTLMTQYLSKIISSPTPNSKAGYS